MHRMGRSTDFPPITPKCSNTVILYYRSIPLPLQEVKSAATPITVSTDSPSHKASAAALTALFTIRNTVHKFNKLGRNVS